MRKGLKIKVILVKKKIFIGIGAVLAIALLAGAAFMAVRLLNTNANGGGPGSLLAGLGGPGGGNSHVAQMLRLTPAPELPVTHPDLTGVVNSIQGNSVFVVQASNVSTTAGEIQTPNGPATEVVVSQKTLIYRDTTLDSVPTPQAGTTTSIGAQQVVEPAELSSISTDSMVQVWGPLRGDRLIAETILVQGTEIIH